jgi:hypothetical protein
MTLEQAAWLSPPAPETLADQRELKLTAMPAIDIAQRKPATSISEA